MAKIVERVWLRFDDLSTASSIGICSKPTVHMTTTVSHVYSGATFFVEHHQLDEFVASMARDIIRWARENGRQSVLDAIQAELNPGAVAVVEEDADGGA